MRPSDRRAALRRLERSVRLRATLNADTARVRSSLPAIVQIVIAAVLSYTVAHFVLGHENPVLAVTVVVASLGFARDARPRSILESAVGMFIGITLSETLLQVAGSGVWQIAVALFVALVVARFILPGNGFAIAAGVQSMFVMITPAPAGGVYTRTVDGLVAGAFALLATALIPRNPSGIAQRDAKVLFSAVDQSLESVHEALDYADEAAATLAFERLRRTQRLIDDWTSSLESAIAVARVSPFLRRQLPRLRRQREVLTGIDLAVRHLRVIVRRIVHLVRDGQRRPVLARLVAVTAEGVRLLGESLDDAEVAAEARVRFVQTIERLDPRAVMPDAPVVDSVLVLMLRPLLVDLLVAAGMPGDEARALLPPIAS